MKTLQDILRELKQRVDGVRAGSRKLVATYGHERAEMAAETRTKVRGRVGALKADVHRLIRTSRHWRTGAPL